MWSELGTNKSAVTSFSLVSCVREKKLLGSTECSQFKPRGTKALSLTWVLGRKVVWELYFQGLLWLWT